MAAHIADLDPDVRLCSCIGVRKRLHYWVNRYPNKGEPAQPHFAKLKPANDAARQLRWKREANGDRK